MAVNLAPKENCYSMLLFEPLSSWQKKVEIIPIFVGLLFQLKLILPWCQPSPEAIEEGQFMPFIILSYSMQRIGTYFRMIRYC